jgi:acetylornithine deacetylase/succinyl-diaminopimelate desuccinylase-like protein
MNCRSRCRFVLGLLAAFALLNVSPLRAQQHPAPAAPAAQAPSSSGVDLDALAQEATGWLTDLIRINTTNPPGNELPAAKYIAGVLDKEGIAAEVIEVSPGRGIVVARLQAGAMADSSQALLLLGHLDVVGVDASKWTVDPFAAVTRDGYLYGRGAIDDKGMVAANLAVFIAIKRSGMRLGRDLVFLADDDEEQGGAASIKPVIAKYWDKFACGYALNEGGLVTLDNGRVKYVAVQSSEKVPYNVTVTARGTSGHASRPLPDNSVVHLSAAIAKIGAFEAPPEPTAVTLRYFEGLAPIEDDETGKWMRAIDQPERLELAMNHLGDMNPAWGAMLHDTIVPTMLDAGVRVNVIPSEAHGNLNIRLMPGDSIHDIIAQLTKTVADSQISFDIAPDSGENAPASSLDSPLYKTIEKVAPQDFPGAIVVPELSTGATDSAQLRLHNVQAFGLLPFPLTDADDARMHADDERVPLASIRTGVGFLYHVVSSFVQAQ